MKKNIILLMAIVGCLIALSATVTWSADPTIYINDFPEDITVNEGDAINIPIFFVGGDLKDKLIELFVWEEDISSSNKKYFGSTGWASFTNYTQLKPVFSLTMIEYAYVNWQAFSSSTGMNSFNIFVCLDGSVDNSLALGTSTTGAYCNKSRKINITKGQVSLTLNPTTLPSGTVNTGYNQTVTMTASGGTSPYTYSCSGSGVSGLTASSSGSTCTISGTPTAAGTYTVTFKVTDSANSTAQKTLSATIAAAPLSLSLSVSSLPAGTVNTSYSQTVTMTASGGTSPYTYSCSGSGVSGLTASSSGSTCTISGTPTAAGTYTVTFKVTDSANSTAQKTLSATVSAASLSLSLSVSSLPDGTKNTAYNQTVTMTASGGASPYTYSCSGSGVSGLTASSSGSTCTISGTPTATGTYTVSFNVTDSSNSTAPKTLSFNVSGGLGDFFTCTPSKVSGGYVTISANTNETKQTTTNITDNCGNTISYTASVASGNSWLTVSTSGTGTMTITVNTTGLSAGTTYTGTVSISSSSGLTAGTLTVYLTVTGPCTPSSASVSPLSISKSVTTGSNADNSYVTIQDNCSNNLAYTVNSVTYSSGSGWITSPTAGSTGTGTMTVSFSTSSLTTGSYSATIRVTPTGYSSVDITVSVSVSEVSTSGEVTLLSNKVAVYFNVSATSIKYFYFNASLSSSSNPLVIALQDMNESVGVGTKQSDMLVRYSGATCDGSLPTKADLDAVKAYCSSVGGNCLQPRWDYNYKVWSPARYRQDLFYSIAPSSSFETVEIGGNVDSDSYHRAGCYYVMVYNAENAQAYLNLSFSE